MYRAAIQPSFRGRDGGADQPSGTSGIHRTTTAKSWRRLVVAGSATLGLVWGCGGGSEPSVPTAPDGGETMPEADAGPPPLFNYPDKLTGSNGAANNQFGFAVAAADDVLVVGAPFFDVVDGDVIQVPVVGAAYVFERDGEGWKETSRLLADDGTTSDLFGFAVGASNDIIAVGAWEHEIGVGHPSCDRDQQGAVYVFERSGALWVQKDILCPSAIELRERFGATVAVSGEFIAIGSPFMDEDNGGTSPAYVFERSPGGAWTEVGLVAAEDTNNALFGFSIAISGETVVVGAPHDNERGIAAGAAYVFERNGGSWSPVAKLTDADGEAEDFFGRSVAIRDNVLVVGADAGGEPTELGTGAAFVFERNDGTWTQVAKLVAANASVDDRFGIAAAVGEGMIAVGAHHQDERGVDSGAIYVFEAQDGGWKQVSKLISQDSAPGDHLGFSVAVSRNTVIGGSRFDDDDGTDSGSVYVFEKRNQP